MIKEYFLNEILEYKKAYKNEKLTYEEKLKIEKEISNLYNVLAITCIAEENFEEARNFYMEEIEMQDKFAGRDYVAVSYGYINIGNTYFSEGNYSEAEDFYIKARETGWKEYTTVKSVAAMKVIAQSYYLLGKVNEKWIHDNDYWGYARDYYMNSLEIYKEIDEKESAVSAINDVILCCQALSELYEKRKNYNMMAKYLDEGLKFGEKLDDAEKALSVPYASCLECVGRWCMINNQYDAADKYYNQALNYRISRLDKTDDPYDKRNVAVSYRNLGNLARMTQNIEDARSFYMKALKMMYEVHEKYPSIMELQEQLNETVKGLVECDDI